MNGCWNCGVITCPEYGSEQSNECWEPHIESLNVIADPIREEIASLRQSVVDLQNEVDTIMECLAALSRAYQGEQ